MIDPDNKLTYNEDKKTYDIPNDYDYYEKLFKNKNSDFLKLLDKIIKNHSAEA